MRGSSDVSLLFAWITVDQMTLYGNIDLAQHWFRKWLVAWWHQSTTWTNIALSSIVFSDIQLNVISQEVLINSIHNMCSYVTPYHISQRPVSQKWPNNRLAGEISCVVTQSYSCMSQTHCTLQCNQLHLLGNRWVVPSFIGIVQIS